MRQTLQLSPAALYLGHKTLLNHSNVTKKKKKVAATNVDLGANSRTAKWDSRMVDNGRMTEVDKHKSQMLMLSLFDMTR